MGCICSTDADGPINPNAVDESHFSMLKVVGKGGFGKVNAVTHRKTGKLMAMKRIRKRLILEREVYVQTVWRERNVMAKWQSPFLLRLLYAFQNKDELFLVMPFMQGGDLRYYLQTKGAMTEDCMRFYACEIILALEEMWHFNVVYRDLKPDNILLDDQGHAALSDFGLAVILTPDNDKIQGSAGTPGYIAPEMLAKKPYDRAVDVWSLGITLYEFLENRRPYGEKEEVKDGAKVGFRHSSLSAECKDLIRGLLTPDPAKRLGCGPTGYAEIKAHPFFQSINWEDVTARRIPTPHQPELDRANCSADFELEDQFFADKDSSLPPIPEDQQANFEGFEWNTVIAPAGPTDTADATSVPTGTAAVAKQNGSSTPRSANAAPAAQKPSEIKDEDSIKRSSSRNKIQPDTAVATKPPTQAYVETTS